MDINPNNIIKELIDFRIKLAEMNGEIIKLGNSKSEAEYRYRLLKAKKIVEFRYQKTPVTILLDLVKGDEEVALLKLEYDKLEVLYHNKMQNIRSLKDVMSVWQSILNYLKLEIGGSMNVR